MIDRPGFSRSSRWLILTILVAATMAGDFHLARADETTDELTTLTVEQAKDIVAHHKGVLSFKNLPEVDLDVARVLCQYKGEVRLNGLRRLTPEVAEMLSRQPKAANLFLNGLTEITPEVARALAVRNGGMLSLNGLTEMPPEIARELANVYAKLALGGVRHLSVESARELAKHRSKLTLMGLPEISDDAAEALSIHRSTFLLNGLTRLTSPVLVQSLLSKSDGFVGFKAVETMTDEVAAVFAKYDGTRTYALDALTELPPANAAALRANEKIVLPAHLRKPGITNSLGMQLAYIPAGKFGMGSPKNEPGRESQEILHEVELTKEYYLGVHEVTVAQFREFVRDTGYATEAERDGKGSWGITQKGNFEQDAKYNWKNPGFEQTDDHPVVDLSWNDANAFCQWLSEMEKRSYRLPTEAEWEYACRAGTRTAYSFGDDPQDLLTAGNASDATARESFKSWSLGIRGRDGFAYSAPVGQLKPNRFGLYDMHGNVWEWCENWYDPTGYSGQQQTDPKGPASGEFKVHRGGGWSSAPERCRSASRIGRHHSAYRGCYLGFRVVLE
jgi:formylglycine-generating enzyme required for sulfatase activity